MLSKLFAKRIKTQNPSRLQGLFPESNFSDNISFGGGCPDESLFPSQALQAAYQKAVDQEQAHSFQYHATTWQTGQGSRESRLTLTTSC